MQQDSKEIIFLYKITVLYLLSSPSLYLQMMRGLSYVSSVLDSSSAQFFKDQPAQAWRYGTCHFMKLARNLYVIWSLW